jgi:hypothetical protein
MQPMRKLDTKIEVVDTKLEVVETKLDKMSDLFMQDIAKKKRKRRRFSGASFPIFSTPSGCTDTVPSFLAAVNPDLDSEEDVSLGETSALPPPPLKKRKRSNHKPSAEQYFLLVARDWDASFVIFSA